MKKVVGLQGDVRGSRWEKTRRNNGTAARLEAGPPIFYCPYFAIPISFISLPMLSSSEAMNLSKSPDTLNTIP